MELISLFIQKGAGDRNMGTYQVEYLTTEREAYLYGMYEINNQWYLVDTTQVTVDNFTLIRPFDYVTVRSPRRGWEGKKMWVGETTLVITDTGMVRTAVKGETYRDSEDIETPTEVVTPFCYSIGCYGAGCYGGQGGVR